MVFEMAMSALGLNDQQKQVVNDAIPFAQAAIDHYNANSALFATLFADIQKCAPAAQILADALGQKQKEAQASGRGGAPWT